MNVETMVAPNKTYDWTDLEQFRNVGGRQGIPTVNISERLGMIFNSAFIQEAGKELSTNTHILLSYSKNSNAIVLDFTTDAKAPGAIKMTRGKNISIAAKSFCNHYRFTAKQVQGHYTPMKHQITGRGTAWVIDLSRKRT